MDAPPIPRLVDLVHVFKGVLVEQFKKRLEEILSDSILLWRLLKLLFKILQKLLGGPYHMAQFDLFKNILKADIAWIESSMLRIPFF